MTEDQPERLTGVTPTAPQKPRIALMGEFSAGKSTLANLLLEHAESPVQATATQLPPVWYRAGQGGCERITMDGQVVPVPAEDWQGHCAQDTQLVFLERQAHFLDGADLIDMPGTSDPNLALQYWEAVLPQVDIVIWCTPANQAWRQSEAAIWAGIDPALQATSVLLVTRMDQIRAEVDVARILHRVSHEAGAQFGAVLPVSLTQAQRALGDDAAMQSCGAADLITYLAKEISALADKPRQPFKPLNLDADAQAAAQAKSEKALPRVRRVVPKRVRSPERQARL